MIPTLGIVDAARLSVQDAVMPTPNMRSTILGWFRPLVLAVVRQQTIDFETKEALVQLATRGVIQPMAAKDLQLKPEGTRTWDWRMIHATPDLALTTEDVILIPRGGKTVQFRVMRALDYSGDGFLMYEIVNDYVERPSSS